MSRSHEDATITPSVAAATAARDMGIGDVSFHAVDVLHGSFPNTSPEVREAFSVMFAAASPKSDQDVACISRTGKDGDKDKKDANQPHTVAKGVDLDRASRSTECPFREDATGSPCAVCACMSKEKVGVADRSCFITVRETTRPRYASKRLFTHICVNAVQLWSAHFFFQCSEQQARACIEAAEFFCAQNAGEKGCK